MRIAPVKALLLAAILLAGNLVSTRAEAPLDPVTGFPREVSLKKEWKPGKKVAVCFLFYVEVWGFGQGPNFRPDMASRNPDLVDEAFRDYAINFGVPRVGSVFKEEDAPLSIALSGFFPGQQPEAWKKFRALQPNAAIVAHGMNNSSAQLPMGKGLIAQTTYVKQVLDLIEKDTGVRPKGWSSPSVYNNVDTFRACAANGMQYSLDAMDTDFLTVMTTPEGKLDLIPYPPVTVDMGQYLGRNLEPEDLEKLWINYVTELSREAEKNPDQPATVVAIGIHPFVVGSPNGAAAMRRTLEALKKLPNVWIADTDSLAAAGK